MDLAKNFTTLAGMFTLKKQSFTQAGKPDFVLAFTNFLLAVLAASIGAFIFDFSVVTLIFSIVGGIIFLPLAYFVVVFIFWGLARLFGGKAQYMQHYTGASYLALLAIPSIIPLIGPLISGLLSLWGIVMHIFLVREIHNLSPIRASLAVLIPYFVLALLAIGLIILFLVLFVGTVSFAALSSL